VKEGMCSRIDRGTCTPMLWKEPQCPRTDEWIKKMWYVYTTEFMLFADKWIFSVITGVFELFCLLSGEK
jgi:hypothetical protein